MNLTKRKPTHPGVLLEENYIKPQGLNLQELAEALGISRNTLYELRTAKASVSAALAVSLGKAFKTSAEMWLNAQYRYDLWMVTHAKPTQAKRLRKPKAGMRAPSSRRRTARSDLKIAC